MHEHEEFLWSGLRLRVERTGYVRPRTIRQVAVGQRPDWVHPQVRFRPVPAALRPRFQALESVRGR